MFTFWVKMLDEMLPLIAYWENLPFLDPAKVKRHLSVGEGLLVQIAAVASDKSGHVVAWGGQTNFSIDAQAG